MTEFAINPALDVVALAKRYALAGRIQIAHFLVADAAERLRQALVTSTAWKHVLNSDAKLFEIERADYDFMPADQRAALDVAIFAAAFKGFQFQYDSIRVSDKPEDRARSDTILDRFAQFMSARATLRFFGRITGQHDIGFADAQATRYQSGDFLTRHDDDVAGKHRRLAYVLGLTSEWRAEWGGLLLFTDLEDEVSEAIVPRFNALTLFAVPQLHSVSCVAPYAATERLSVTGWLREHHNMKRSERT